MTLPPRVSVAVERWIDGLWGDAFQPSSVPGLAPPPLLDGLMRMPAPMETDAGAVADWAGTCDASVRGLLLLIREHLVQACRYLLLDRSDDAAQHLNAAMTVLGHAGGGGGSNGSSAIGSVESVRELALQALPDVLIAQMELHRAVAYGGLPPRLAVVLGMHRSGTSALTGMLAQAGLDVPDDLMDRPDDVINLKGYWESEGLMQVNDSLFADLGLHWSSSDQLPVNWWTTQKAVVWRRHLIRQLTQTCRGTQHPVIKDPRMCVLMAGMRPLFNAAVVDFCFFIPVRHPMEVARSLQSAQGTSLGRGLALWIAHVREAERQTRGQRRLILSFNDLLQEPDAVLAQCRQITHPGDLDAGLTSQAAGFIDPSLQRQRKEERLDDISSDVAPLLNEAMALHDILVNHPGDNASLHQQLDAVTPGGGTSG